MRGIAFCVMAFMLLVSCGDNGVKREEIALQTAKVYYDRLLQGDYDAYVDGTLHGDSVPPAYRQQLVLNMQMFMERQEREHGGISTVTPLRAVVDSSTNSVNAFLAIIYADSVQEEIVVPMMERDGVWYLK